MCDTLSETPKKCDVFEDKEIHEITKERQVALVDNPGVSKSALLNATGGFFTNGYSPTSDLTKEVATKRIPFQNGQAMYLFDAPGIDDNAEEDSEDSIVKHLQMLQDTLNSGGLYTIFFVITPRNGRIEPSDYVIMKAVPNSLKARLWLE
ncbi:hypothetical protein FBU30_004355 [Linnemannia zychae]|nr:hypothetical protein FBU30_004355 [Linnemannia zychae]